jgi:hypothetical protein
LFIAPDESFIIFVSSRRRDGSGSGDLYVSFRAQDGSWIRAINMGDEIALAYRSPQSGLGDVYWMYAGILDDPRKTTNR